MWNDGDSASFLQRTDEVLRALLELFHHHSTKKSVYFK